MRTLALSLVIALLALPAQARGVRLSAADTCPDKATASAKSAAPARAAAPARDEARPRATVHGDIDVGPRRSPRWHSFMPGMFR